MDYRSVNIGSAVIAAAMDKAIADGDSAAANDSRIFQSNDSFFERGRGHHDLPSRAGRVSTLNRFVVPRVSWIVDDGGEFFSAFSGDYIARPPHRVGAR